VCPFNKRIGQIYADENKQEFADIHNIRVTEKPTWSVPTQVFPVGADANQHDQFSKAKFYETIITSVNLAGMVFYHVWLSSGVP